MWEVTFESCKKIYQPERYVASDQNNFYCSSCSYHVESRAFEKAIYQIVEKIISDQHNTLLYQVLVNFDGQKHRVYRRYNDFYLMHTTLLKLFPNEAGENNNTRTIPFMPGKTILLPGQRKMKLAQQRIPVFNQYFKDLLSMDERISRHKTIRQTLARQPEDEVFEQQFGKSNSESRGDDSSDEEEEDVFKKKKKKSLTKKAGGSISNMLSSAMDTFSSEPSGKRSSPAPSAASTSNSLDNGRAVVLFASDEKDTGSGWQGAKLKARKRDPNQYQAFALPWSKTSQMKLDNLFFCELMMCIAKDLPAKRRKDVFNFYEECITGKEIGEYLVGNVEGMDTIDESLPVGQEMVNLGALRVINTTKFDFSSNSYFYVAFTQQNLRISLGTINHLISRTLKETNGNRIPEIDEMERAKAQTQTGLRLLMARFGDTDTPLPPESHKLRSFAHTMPVACDVCDKAIVGKLGVKCENCGINLHDGCVPIVKQFTREYCFYPPFLPEPIVSGQFERELQQSKGLPNRYVPSLSPSTDFERSRSPEARPSAEAPRRRNRSLSPDAKREARNNTVTSDAMSAIKDLQGKVKQNRPRSRSFSNDDGWDDTSYIEEEEDTPVKRPVKVASASQTRLPAARPPPPALFKPTTSNGSLTAPAPPALLAAPASPRSSDAPAFPPRSSPTARTSPSPAFPPRASNSPTSSKPPVPPSSSSVTSSSSSSSSSSSVSFTTAPNAFNSTRFGPIPSTTTTTVTTTVTASSSISPPPRSVVTASSASGSTLARSASSSAAASSRPRQPPPPSLTPAPMTTRSSVPLLAKPPLATTTTAATITTTTTTTSSSRLAGSTPAPKKVVKKLPANFAADREAVLGGGDLSAADREKYYQDRATQAEQSGQFPLAQAILKMRKIAWRGAAEVREWDKLLMQHGEVFETDDW